MHLRNAPTRLMRELGYARRYRYAHGEPEGYVADERYLPEGLPHPRLLCPRRLRTGNPHPREAVRLQELDRAAAEREPALADRKA